MRISNALIASRAVASVMAKTININVGQNGLVFEPNTTIAAQWDIISFTFFRGNHNVVEGDYNVPCQTGDSGMPFYSGFFGSVGSDGQANQTFNVPINDTDPIYYYCSHSNHCQKGMVAVINPSPESEDSLETYALNAQNVTAGMVDTPRRLSGGTFQLNKASNSTSTSGSGGSGDVGSQDAEPTSGPRTSGNAPGATKTTSGGRATETANAGSRFENGIEAVGVLVAAAVAAVL